MVELVWLIPALPLAGFVLLWIFGSRMGDPWAGWLGTIMVAASFVAAIVVFAGLVKGPEQVYDQSLFTWIPAGSFSVDLGFYLDHLSGTMMLFITGIGALINLYSIGYMHGDPRFPKFFLYLNLFVFSMLMLVLGNNFVVTFLGWEGVGTCSYFLISFWFEKPANASAGKKAFVTNRVGDWGFMIAMFATFITLGSLNFSKVLPLSPGLATATATFIALMFFVGAVGKSAQIPLYIWLPDAMAGPTPVSALIHAATMVTAGVYLMCRINPILAVADPGVSTLIAWIGVITALVAACIAMAQMDIKKVLAFSTVSQLGYMFLAVGLHAYWAAIFHMITHAFFKATMFLGSGSVIHGMHDEQDMRRMGNLKKYMPITAGAFICGWLAISGIPPFSGFWSKDEILGYAFNAGQQGSLQGYALYAIGLFTALLTAFYMSRLVYRTFYGQEKWPVVPAPEHEDQPLAEAFAAADEETQAAAIALVPDIDLAFDPEPKHSTHVGPDYHPHESPWTMTLPLIVLGFLSVVGGFISLPLFDGKLEFLEHWLEPVFENGNPADLTLSNGLTIGLLCIGALTGLAGIAFAYSLWHASPERAKAGTKLEPALFGNGFFYDLTIARFMGGPGRAFANGLAWFDRTVIDGAVVGIGVVTVQSGAIVRRVQSGYVRRYALGLALGTVVLLGFLVTRVLAT